MMTCSQIQMLIDDQTIIILQFNINNMVKAQSIYPQIPVCSQGFKRTNSFESASTIQDSDRLPHSRIIPAEIKAKFIYLITKQNYSMKEAAKKVQMSYSTAKKIYGRFRRSNLEKNSIAVEDKAVRASFSETMEKTVKNISIVCLIAGNPQNR